MKNTMTFDDIYLLKNSAVKLVLKEIDVMELEYALMEATAEVKNAFFRNMSKRAEQMITEDMQYNTNVSRKDSLEAQQKILDVMFGLEKLGKIKLLEE
ncbi:FliG C-terminal domain-containing protein [uncultured Treponema sp.]|uniref:FliG C-terminal domain-containing protein n=1 Tax=uncultured Treponema sp. TaxID=162155 RepID=UPI0025FD6FC6|nr:FliG C-terminal domain-containing protein [uncultured Treponema sp.]